MKKSCLLRCRHNSINEKEEENIIKRKKLFCVRACFLRCVSVYLCHIFYGCLLVCLCGHLHCGCCCWQRCHHQHHHYQLAGPRKDLMRWTDKHRHRPAGQEAGGVKVFRVQPLLVEHPRLHGCVPNRKAQRP